MEDGKYVFVKSSNEKATVEWHFPTGWYNTKKSAIFCMRMPKRQYLKGISANHNMEFLPAESMVKDYVVTTNANIQALLQVLGKVASITNPATMKATFDNPTYFGFEESYIVMKEKKAFARALSPDFALLPHPSSKDFTIFCHDLAVAEVVTKNKIKMLLPHFKSECFDFFQKEGISVVS
jgi:hypothetical protein